MKRLLFIAHRIPFPPNKGDKIRSYHLLQYLSSRYTVDLAFLVDNADDLRHVDELRCFAASIHYAVIPAAKKVVAAVSALLHNDPISIPYFYSKELQRSLDKYLDEVKPSCVFCFSSPSAEYVFRSKYREQLAHSSRLIMDLIDLDSLKWAQYAQQRPASIMGIIFNREARLLARYEEKVAHTFHTLLLVSEAEKQLCPQAVREKVTVVPNGVDLLRFAPGQGKAIQSDGPMIVFTGAMDYWPNIDAVIWFSKEIFPFILSAAPSAHFFIVGVHPKPEVLELGTEKNVVVTGFVEDIRDYIAAADVCVAPLRIARGIQNKVLEAMAMGKAVVATPQAMEGITGDGGQQVMIADTVEDFSRKVTYLLHNQSAREILGKGARKAMESHYSWGSNLAHLDGLTS